MANRINEKFKKLKKQKKSAFIAYITAGDPNLGMTKKIAILLEEAGVDIIELGIPFSDPIADGPTIQAASYRALQKKTSLKRVFKAAGELRKYTNIPFVFMTYFNPVLKYGVEKFVKDSKRCGVDGVIIPDLPCEEASDLVRSAKNAGIAVIFLAAPTSTRPRIGMIAKKSSGFIYYVSLTGVTGARRKLPHEVTSKIRMIKSMTKKPVAVGFGISNVSQASDMAKIADGVIIGSAIVKMIEHNQKDQKAMLSKIKNFAKKLAKAIHNA